MSSQILQNFDIKENSCKHIYVLCLIINKYNSKTCIDHIYINNYFYTDSNEIIDSDTLKSYILKTSITDHFSTIITIRKSNCKPTTNDH